MRLSNLPTFILIYPLKKIFIRHFDLLYQNPSVNSLSLAKFNKSGETERNLEEQKEIENKDRKSSWNEKGSLGKNSDVKLFRG